MARIEYVFPEFGGIYGETFNIEYLKRCSSEIEVIYTGHKERPAFLDGSADMIYLGCMTEKNQEKVIELLKPHRENLIEQIERGTVFLVTGNAIEIFGNEIIDGDRRISALGIFDFTARRYMDEERHNSHFRGIFEGIELLGHKSQFSFSYGDFSQNRFIELTGGTGMNPETMDEGIRVNNFFATYSLGPFLILNPPFAKYILRKLKLDDALALEKEIMEAYEYRKK